jgi:hypothetical protein
VDTQEVLEKTMNNLEKLQGSCKSSFAGNMPEKVCTGICELLAVASPKKTAKRVHLRRKPLQDDNSEISRRRML